MALVLAVGFAVPALAAAPEPAPEYSARLLGGDQQVTLAELRGRVVLLNAWATWCPPCRAEMPDFEAVHQRYRERGLAVVGVNIDEGQADESVQRYVQSLGISFAIWRDPSNRFGKRFRVLGVPETFLIDREGLIARRWRGPMDPHAAGNREAIEAVLGPSAMPVTTGPPPGGKAAILRGRRLAEQRGCFNCHSTDGSKGVGPSWKGMGGREVTLADGRRVPRDRAYLVRAIRDPDAEIVADYPKGVMTGALPGKRLSDAEVEAVVDYLESVSTGLKE